METPVCPRQHTGRRESRERRCVVTAARPEDEWPPAQRQLEGGDSPLAWSLGPILTWINHRDPEAVQLAAAVIDLRLSAVSVCGSQYLMETEFPTTTVWTLCTFPESQLTPSELCPSSAVNSGRSENLNFAGCNAVTARDLWVSLQISESGAEFSCRIIKTSHRDLFEADHDSHS
ncbi:uncharacterized protein LOC125714561 isoform X2 [Brienomyrus brachyistius]|uniref:uncharacterized protein LOC125714561 isoform X2 n=1 Tax=Brienomyrus brachyistius TaxID=42636 RepID=UPI0020B3744B|nr:uncharacterized protein LOC125714561 isoform X2 [Brienomyrus brachyistius]